LLRGGRATFLHPHQGKEQHVADRGGLCEEHDEPIDADAKATCRRHPLADRFDELFIMESQPQLVHLVLQAEAGKQVTLDTLASTVQEMLLHPSEAMKQAGLKLARDNQGAVQRTYEVVQRLMVDLKFLD